MNKNESLLTYRLTDTHTQTTYKYMNKSNQDIRLRVSPGFQKCPQLTKSELCSHCVQLLTHWGRVTHICVSKLSILASDNGLSPGRRQAIIWTNAGILLIGPLGTKFSEILIEINTFSFKKMHLKMSSGKWRPFVSASMCLDTQPNGRGVLSFSQQTERKPVTLSYTAMRNTGIILSS